MAEAIDSPSSSRALVVCGHNDNEPMARGPSRHGAGFLTHLIATKWRLPQACERRRAEPDEAIAAYKATIARLQALNERAR
jgi:hypothetical protein